MGPGMPHQHFHSKRGFLIDDTDAVFATRSSFFQLNCCLNLHYNEKWLQASVTPLKSDEFCNVRDDFILNSTLFAINHRIWLCYQTQWWFITFQNPTQTSEFSLLLTND